jgi:glucosamine--fructose-6-phosphate aminotransferase (isomerizing)
MRSAAIVNAEHSQIARHADTFITLNIGKEYAVASTKAFTAQILLFHLLSASISDRIIDKAELNRILSIQISHVLSLEHVIIDIAKLISAQSAIIFTGKQESYANIVEACLKMQELSYIASMPFASGEFKHGPLALVSESSLIIFLALEYNSSGAERTYSQVQEILTRGGTIILFCCKYIAELVHQNYSSHEYHEYGKEFSKSYQDGKLQIIILSENSEQSYCVDNIGAAISFQLLAYHAAVILGNDVDRPRNLAKSVTVE